MTGRAGTRGQPVAALLVLIIGWCVARAMLWETPFPTPLAAVAERAVGLGAPIPRERPGARFEPAPLPLVVPPVRSPREPVWPRPADGAAPPPSGWTLAPDPTPASEPISPRVAGGHVLLLASAFAQLGMAPDLAVLVQRAPTAAPLVPAFPLLVGDTARAPGKRWSGDAWLLLRRDTTRPITSGRGSYGQSQIGAVLRYRIAPSNGHRPAAYVRASTTLAASGAPEAAAGFTGRPVPGVPVAFAAEMRAARLYSGMAVRPAVFTYSEFPPIKLPFGARGEAYLQGGYVGGRFATPFVDGQVRVDHALARLGSAELRAGGGAWGGAQKGAKRLDIGPGATVAVKLGGAPVRMSADWRFRVAGDANPSSGPALTVSTGF